MEGIQMLLKGSRILVNVPEPTDQTPGGIFIPQSAQKPRNIGSVVAVGDTADQSLMDKEIMFHIQSAQSFEYNGVNLKLIFATDIIAIL